MTWIKKSTFIIGVLSFGIFTLAWASKNNHSDFPVALLFLATSLALIALIIQFSALRTLFTPIISLFFALTLAELILFTYLDVSLTHYDPTSSYSNEYSKNVEGYGSRLIPGIHDSRKLMKNGEVMYEVIYSIGNDGYRQEHAPAPFDAYLFGGSFVFGEGLNDNETISAFLFNEHGKNIKNVGIHGYGLHQALYSIKNGITSINGVNILLTAPWHAPRSSCKPSWVTGTFRYYVNSKNLVILNGFCPGGYLFNRILSKSNIYILLKRAGFFNKNKITDQDIDLYLAIINTIYQETQKNNSSLIVAYIDATEDEMTDTSWTNEALIERIKELSDTFIDVTLADKTEQLSLDFFIHDLDRHPSAMANQARAALLSNILK